MTYSPIRRLHPPLILIAATLWIAAFCLDPLPKVFVVGDSISMQYGAYLEDYLMSSAHYARKTDNAGVDPKLGVPEVNGGDSRMVLEYLRAKVKDADFNPDYLLLNCGLHDIKRYPGTNKNQVSKQHYGENLELILELMNRKNIQVIWLRTTPVVDSIHNAKSKRFKRYAADLKAYNEIADQVMAAKSIPVIDLHTFTRNLGEEQLIDHVHYSEEARKLQAAFIAGYLKSLISDF